MGGDATPREEVFAPDPHAQGREQAEVSGTLNRSAAKAQLACRVIVVDRLVPIIGLRGQHVPWRPPGADKHSIGLGLDRRIE